MTATYPSATALPVLDPEAVAALGADLRGELLAPGDDGYDAARRVWNGMIDKHPALIARCGGVADVIAAVALARDNRLLLAVRGGGHNIAGKGTCDGGLVVDLAPMKGIRVDLGMRTVRAEGGVLWRELDRETQAFGLATTGGFISTTGIAGLTLGGGFGWLMRAHGLASDNLVAADVVTADGALVHASAEDHPDLFWALHGGGGNFGVVTSLEYRLHEVGPEVLAGPLFHPMEAARDVLRRYRDLAPTMPDALSCAAALLTSPEGAPLAALVPAYVGPVADGEAAVRPLRAIGSPVADLVGPLPYRSLQQLFDPAFPAGRRSYWKSGFLRGLDDGAIDTMVEHFARVPSPHSAVFLEQFGGAVARVGPERTAFPHRSAPFNLIVLAGWDDPAADATNVAWARELWAAMRPFAAEGVYVNYLGDVGDEGADRLRAAYGAATYDRLAKVKARYDPDNLFRVNQNIPPTG
jgi:FAD/FMN-containing dehydrogenase